MPGGGGEGGVVTWSQGGGEGGVVTSSRGGGGKGGVVQRPLVFHSPPC